MSSQLSQPMVQSHAQRFETYPISQYRHEMSSPPPQGAHLGTSHGQNQQSSQQAIVQNQHNQHSIHHPIQHATHSQNISLENEFEKLHQEKLEYQTKLEEQLQEFATIKQALSDLETNFDRIKYHYEEKIHSLKRKFGDEFNDDFRDLLQPVKKYKVDDQRASHYSQSGVAPGPSIGTGSGPSTNIQAGVQPHIAPVQPNVQLSNGTHPVSQHSRDSSIYPQNSQNGQKFSTIRFWLRCFARRPQTRSTVRSCHSNLCLINVRL